jgi:tetratricopeptide (TPR) repeat protein
MDVGDNSHPADRASRTDFAAAEPWFGGLEQADFEIDFYQRILDRRPQDVRWLKQLGELYARQGRIDSALGIDRRLVGLLPDDPIAHYNLACSLVMQGSLEQALDALGRALEIGYNDFSHLEIDPDLESLRRLPQYQGLLQQYGLQG